MKNVKLKEIERGIPLDSSSLFRNASCNNAPAMVHKVYVRTICNPFSIHFTLISIINKAQHRMSIEGYFHFNIHSLTSKLTKLFAKGESTKIETSYDIVVYVRNHLQPKLNSIYFFPPVQLTGLPLGDIGVGLLIPCPFKVFTFE